MESTINNKIFGIDSLIALGKAMGFNPSRAMAKISPEELTRLIDMAMEKEIKKRGAWYKDIIVLKAYIILIDMYKTSPEMQRKAYGALRVHVRTCEFLDYEAIVNDSAFGNMIISKGGE
jgi:hypothetical protein